ncbi:LOW QUALITY PROTEIN: uncharacterized protein LOC108098032 [Drosophila ficusphila]|uniref:LOW QUALITY PROTEIN: uncharacterized protein LOC108098032 n=1 Tax=Drosophila ficusphila TaxID=30025 RepID=UPI0007E7BC7B|nr:LOW QUALITY PROTEIN: uncharacterized protein LOC108098032 [Drosophila ficusphila]
MLNIFVWFSLSFITLSWAQGSRSYLPPPNPAMEPIITKQFYSISPAEDPEDWEPKTKHLIIGQPRRNYRVIFIRAPGSNNDRVKYTAELAPQEERTVIYVLTRKQPELEATDIVAPQEKPQAEQKPDVFFIKYKTNEEATAAQKEIQTQYDQLGGNTEISAPYVAPIHSVIGAPNPPPNPHYPAAPYQRSTGGYHYDKPSSTILAPVERSY